MSLLALQLGYNILSAYFTRTHRMDGSCPLTVFERKLHSKKLILIGSRVDKLTISMSVYF